MAESQIARAASRAPAVPGLGQRLEHGHGGDPGSSAFGHERGQRREGIVGGLVEDQTPAAGRAGRRGSGGQAAGHVDESSISAATSVAVAARPRGGAEQVEGPRHGQEPSGSNSSPGPGDTAARTCGIGEGGEGVGHHGPHRVPWCAGRRR